MKLSERVAAGERSNELDVLVEVALFTPGIDAASARANHAGTKVIYTYSDGSEETFRAVEWLRRRNGNRAEVITALQALGL